MTRLKPKLAIIYGPLLHYRVALFDALSEYFQLTVFTTRYNGLHTSSNFDVVEIASCRVGSFYFQPGLRERLRIESFDLVISFLDVRHIDALSVVFRPIAPRTFCWGVWLTDSIVANFLRLAAIRRCEAALFYCQAHLQEVVCKIGECTKLYVAPNSIAVSDPIPERAFEERDAVLFVGSFLARKGLDRLVRLFSAALPQLPDKVQLVLVGDGPERERIEKLIFELGLQRRIQMPGRIDTPEALNPYYARALVSVSLDQAGLSVLQSMGFGVPFLTIRGSISGGEVLNINNRVTGFVVEDDDSEILEAIRISSCEPIRMARMGAAAREHYCRYASIGNYVQGFRDMIDGTRNAQVWSGRKIDEVDVATSTITEER